MSETTEDIVKIASGLSKAGLSRSDRLEHNESEREGSGQKDSEQDRSEQDGDEQDERDVIAEQDIENFNWGCEFFIKKGVLRRYEDTEEEFAIRLTDDARAQMRAELDANPQEQQQIFRENLYVTRQMYRAMNMLHREHRRWPDVRKTAFGQINIMHAVSEVVRPPLEYELLFAELLSDLSIFLLEESRHEKAMCLLRTAKNICDELLPEKPFETMAVYPIILAQLAAAESYDGIPGRFRGLGYLLRASILQKKYVNTLPADTIKKIDHVKTSWINIELLSGWLQNEKLAPAGPLLERIRNASELVGGAENQDICFSYTLGSLLKAGEGLVQAAHDMSEKGCTLMRKSREPFSHLAIRSSFLKAVTLFNAGNLEQAQILHMEVYDIRWRVLGDDHDETLSSLYCIAVCQHCDNQLEMAERNLRRILEHTEVGLKWRLEDLARAAFRLSLVARQRGEHAQAEYFARKAWNNRWQWEHLIPADLGSGSSGDRYQMARFDYGVHLWHGRTAGIWNKSIDKW